MKPFTIIPVTDSLYLSNKVWLERDLDVICQNGIGAIVNLVEDHSYAVPQPLVCLNCGFPDSTHITTRQLDDIYAFIDLHQPRSRVLVHCSAGVSRSAGIVIGQLMRENPTWTWQEAFEVVNAKRSIWVSAETRESVLAYLAGSATPLPASEIHGDDAQALQQVQRVCGVRLEQVRAIGWNTRGYVIESDRVVGLGLYDLGLESLPPAVYQLAKLRYLSLCDNHLEELSGEIVELGMVQNLNLSGNRLISLPGEIGELSRIEVIHASGNRLELIPDSIQKLSGLTRLYLHKNCLIRLPEIFGELANLTELYLQNNRLVHLPESIGSLQSLQWFSAYANQIEELPASMGNLSQLVAVSLAQNRIAALPEALGRLSQLDNLNINSNQLKSLPSSLVALKKLRRLNIAYNPLDPLPASLERWLQDLRDRGCIVIRSGLSDE
jgi:hypothetical protein